VWVYIRLLYESLLQSESSKMVIDLSIGKQLDHWLVPTYHTRLSTAWVSR